MKTVMTGFVCLLICHLNLASCSQADGNNLNQKNYSGEVKPRAGYISGKATTAAGKPLAGATIAISGFSGDGQQVNRYVETKPDGTYELKMPAGGLYRVNNAHASIMMEGVKYSHRLHPLEKNIEALKPVDKGLVSNFVLKLRGLKPQEKNQFVDPKLPGSYYGQHILAELRGSGSQNTSADAIVEIKLMSTGLLADGTKGSPVVFKRTIKNLYTATGHGYDLSQTEILPDIPLGNYIASATLTEPGGAPQILLLSSRANEEKKSTTAIKFKPAGSVGIEGFILTLHIP